MVQFIESPMYDNWFKDHIPEREVLICSPYMKQVALDKILELYDIENRCEELEIKILIRGAIEEFTYSKSSDISVLELFHEMDVFNKVNVKRVTNLHMKAYLIDEKYLLITSGNMTKNGMFVIKNTENFEGGIATDDPDTIKEFLNYFLKIWEQGEKLEDFYDELMDEYKAYIKSGSSDNEMVKEHIRRKKYEFDKHSLFDRKIESNISPEREVYNIDKLLPVGYIKYLDDTLKILEGHPEGLSYEELGDRLRKKYEMEEGRNKKTNNIKFGEEKGKFATYFGLARLLVSDGGNKFEISELGKWFTTLSKVEKAKYLKDRLLEKSAVCAIFEAMDESDEFDLQKFLKEQYKLKDTTLSRICAALKDLIKYLKESNLEGELKEILEKLK